MLAPAWVSSCYSFMPRASMLRSWSLCKTACLKIPLAIFISSQEKSDVAHDLLAFLAEMMLGMNKHSSRRSRLPGWLEGYLGTKVEDLTPKTAARRATASTNESFAKLKAEFGGKWRKHGKPVASGPRPSANFKCHVYHI